MDSKAFGIVVGVCVFLFIAMAGGLGFIQYRNHLKTAVLQEELAMTKAMINARQKEFLATKDKLAIALEDERKLKDERNRLAAELSEMKQVIKRFSAQPKRSE